MTIWPHMRELLLRLRGGFQSRKQLEQDFADELAFHVAMREGEQEGAGVGRSDAVRQARVDLGGVEKWKEALRDVGQPRMLENLASDIRLAVRLLRKSPTFTVVALATLTVAIGANTAVFSLLNTLMLRPLPVPEADRLVVLSMHPGDGSRFTYSQFRDLEKTSAVFLNVLSFYRHTFQLRGPEGTESVPGVLVSGNYFAALRVAPSKGRWIIPADDQSGGGEIGPVAVISHRLWQTRFSGDPAIVGRKIVLGRLAFTVVGVMPAGFFGFEVGRRPDIFVALALEPEVNAPYSQMSVGSGYSWLPIAARLRDGETLQEANAFLRVISKSLMARSVPDPVLYWGKAPMKESDRYVVAESGATGFNNLRFNYRKPVLVLMALVSIVLFVACLNLASLITARSVVRQRELATRFALGAARGRLLQQILTENTLIVMAGAVLGFCASLLVSPILPSFLVRQDDPLYFGTAPDWRVFAFTALTGAVTTILIGLFPALKATNKGVAEQIKGSSATMGGSEQRRLWPRLLTGSEVALALVLIVGAGLLGYSLVQLHSAELGFDPRRLSMLPLEMSKQRRDGKAVIGFYEEFAEALARVNGVEKVSYAGLLPISGMQGIGYVKTPGQPDQQISLNEIGPEYFATMRMPVFAGREFRWTDTDTSGRKAVLNRKAAQMLFPLGHAIGQRVLTGNPLSGYKEAEVIGVVGNAKDWTVRGKGSPMVYSSITQDVVKRPSYILMVRSAGRLGAVIAAARSILRRLAPDVPLPKALSMQQEIADSLATERMMATLASFFAVTALLITAMGLYGTLAYATARRTGEIGIRMALGAQRGDIIWLILRENSVIVLGGCIAGLLGSLACARWIASLLYQVRSDSPAVLIVSIGVLLLAGLLASLIPAVRASRIDPMTAIRHE